MIEINDLAGINQMQTYVSLRDTPRMLMTQRVYGVAKRTLAEYQKLVLFLQENAGYVTLHDTTTAQVQPHIQTPIDALQTIVTTMDQVETEAPGTFPGIEMT